MIRRPPRSTLFPYTTALPIFAFTGVELDAIEGGGMATLALRRLPVPDAALAVLLGAATFGIGCYLDRKSTRLNSSHANISYAVFCLKKKKAQGSVGSHHES